MKLLYNPNFLSVIIEMRARAAKYLPIDNSLIPFDLLFKISMAHWAGTELTIKSLFADLPHSEMGMRYHYRRLLEKGWIQVFPSPSDKRSKVVVPTNKLLERLVKLDLEIGDLVLSGGSDPGVTLFSDRVLSETV